MARQILERVRELALPFIALGFAVGVLLGLLLGWQVWPIKWYDTDPSDLRPEHQMSFVVMVADSLVVTGDVEAARQRLAQLIDDDTSWNQVGDLTMQTAADRERAGDRAAAWRVRNMAETVGISAVAAEPFQAPEKRIAPAPNGFLLLLGLALFIVGLAALVWLVTRYFAKRAARRAEAEPMDDLLFAPDSLLEASPVPPSAFVEAPPGSYPESAYADSEEDEPASYRVPFAGALFSEPPSIETEAHQEESEIEVPLAAASAPGPFLETKPSEIVPPVPSRVASVTLGSFEAEYHFGDDDFDLSFPLTSPDNDFLGECGLGINDIIEADDAQKVDAFELWLFDQSSIHTVSKLLVSEYAHAHKILAPRLGDQAEMVAAGPGVTITLEANSLQLVATVLDCSYRPGEDTPNAVFAHLHVKIDVIEVTRTSP